MKLTRFAIGSALGVVTALSSTATEARFLQTDPVGYDDQVNLYAYSSNDPINAADPTGTRTIVRNGRVYIIPEQAGRPVVRIPNNVGARGISERSMTFHTYQVSSGVIRSARPNLGQSIASQPTPGPNNSPASAGGTLNNAGYIPTAGSTNMVRSFVVLSPDPSRYTDITVNYTVAGKHDLAEGFVMRYGLLGSDGRMDSIQTYGEGDSWRQAPALEGVWGPQVQDTWRGVDRGVICTALDMGCKK